MGMTDTMDDVDRWVRRAQQGDEAAFGLLVDRFRPELIVHCYRMLGRYDDAEDATQDALVRAWRGLASFRADSRVRTWLYRIATNVCLDRRATDQRRRALLAAGQRQDGTVIPVAATVPWLQMMPDEVLDAVDERQPDHDDRLTSRETIELAYIAALQHLRERPRAVFLLRDVVGWTAAETAAELGTSVSATNATLHRARTTMREVLASDREGWSTSPETGPAEPTASAAPVVGDAESQDAAATVAVVRQFARAVENGDTSTLSALLAPNVAVSHQPHGGQPTGETGWYSGRDHVIEEWRPAFPLDLRMVPLRVNRQLAFACYARLPGTDEHRPFSITVLRLEGERVVEVMSLDPTQFTTLGVPDRPGPRTREIAPTERKDS